MDGNGQRCSALSEMEAIHLDTNCLVYYTNGDDEALIERLDAWLRKGGKFCVSAMVWAEFLCGPLTSEDLELAQALIVEILPINQQDAALAGFLFQETGRRARSLPDCIIAATAIRAEVALVTKNHDDFKAFIPHGLQLL